jgi:hypothetical protein
MRLLGGDRAGRKVLHKTTQAQREALDERRDIRWSILRTENRNQNVVKMSPKTWNIFGASLSHDSGKWKIVATASTLLCRATQGWHVSDS